MMRTMLHSDINSEHVMKIIACINIRIFDPKLFHAWGEVEVFNVIIHFFFFIHPYSDVLIHFLT